MARLKLDQDALAWSLLMERRAKVTVKDCFKGEDTVYFVVAPGHVGKAIGKGAVNIKRFQNELQKKIRIVEYDASASQFIRNLINPLKVEEITENQEEIIIKDSSKKTKSLLIGRGGKNLRVLERAVQRFFPQKIKIE